MADSTSCPICSGCRSARMRGRKRKWQYRRCLACNHAWLWPLPRQEELDAYYNSAYSVPLERYMARTSVEFPAIYRLVTRLASEPSRMLEVGCSYGAMLARFGAAGWKGEGVEPDARAAPYAPAPFRIP